MYIGSMLLSTRDDRRMKRKDNGTKEEKDRRQTLDLFFFFLLALYGEREGGSFQGRWIELTLSD